MAKFGKNSNFLIEVFLFFAFKKFAQFFMRKKKYNFAMKNVAKYD